MSNVENNSKLHNTARNSYSKQSKNNLINSYSKQSKIITHGSIFAYTLSIKYTKISKSPHKNYSSDSRTRIFLERTYLNHMMLSWTRSDFKFLVIQRAR